MLAEKVDCTLNISTIISTVLCMYITAPQDCEQFYSLYL